MKEDHSQTAAPDASLRRRFLTGEAPQEGAPPPVRIAPQRRPARDESGEGGDG